MSNQEHEVKELIEEDTQQVLPEKSMLAKFVDLFGGAKQFNAAMAIFGPSILNVIQSQTENENPTIAMFQFGTGLITTAGNFLLFKNGDPSLHCRLGMFNGAMKALMGCVLFGVGLASTMGLEEGMGVASMVYLAYCAKTLASVVDLFNAAAYGKEALSQGDAPRVKND